jgi:hypothetical protein
LAVTAYYGKDETQDPAFDYYSRTYVGVLLDTSVSVAAAHTPYLQLRYQGSDYDDIDPLFGSARSDSYVRATAGWLWRWHPRWSWRAEVDYSRNTSDVELYEFDRTRFFLSARYEVR